MTNEQIEEYAKMIYSQIKDFPNYKYKDDLFQSGSLGLLKAFKNYDESRGVKLSTYAHLSIFGEMRKQAREDKGIKISRSITKLYPQIEKGRMLLTQKLMREPTIYELSEYLDLEESLIIECLNSVNCLQSLDEPIKGEENDMSLYEIYGEEQDIDTKIMLEQALESLDEIELKIYRLRYEFGLSQTKIAEYLNTSQVQVSRLESKVKQKLKRKLMLN